MPWAESPRWIKALAPPPTIARASGTVIPAKPSRARMIFKVATRSPAVSARVPSRSKTRSAREFCCIGQGLGCKRGMVKIAGLFPAPPKPALGRSPSRLIVPLAYKGAIPSTSLGAGMMWVSRVFSPRKGLLLVAGMAVLAAAQGALAASYEFLAAPETDLNRVYRLDRATGEIGACQ